MDSGFPSCSDGRVETVTLHWRVGGVSTLGLGLVTMLAAAPDVIARYFQLTADRDVDGVAALFTEAGTVVDERQTHEGTAAIRAWRAGPASRFQYTTEVLATEAHDSGHHVVTARLTGNFPGGRSSSGTTSRFWVTASPASSSHPDRLAVAPPRYLT